MFRKNQDPLVSGIKNAFVIIPDPQERIGYSESLSSNLRGGEDENHIYRVILFNEKTRCNIDIRLVYDVKIKEPLDALNQFPGSSALPLEGSLSGRKIGQKMWYRRSTLSSGSFYVSEKQIGIAVALQRFPQRRGEPATPLVPISAEEIRLAEDMVLKMLDRLTVLGLTSRPKESAPGWAKRQVERRLAGRRG